MSVEPQSDRERRLILEMTCSCGATLSIDYRPPIQIGSELVILAESWNKTHAHHVAPPGKP